jgi:hypothetical protein
MGSYGAQKGSMVSSAGSFDPSPIVKGLSSVCALGIPGPILPLPESSLPIIAGDEDTAPPYSVVAVASHFGKGRVFSLGHEGFFTNEALSLFDNRKLGVNAIDWLDGLGKRKVLVTTGHGEWYGGSNFDGFKAELERQGYSVVRSSGRLDPASLSNVSVVIIGNTWGYFLPSEIDALRNFVANGGGLVLLGLGWSWLAYNPGKTLDDYPMNKVGEVFGLRWIDGYISDPTNSYGGGQPIFHSFYPSLELLTFSSAFTFVRSATEAHPNDLPALLEKDRATCDRYIKGNILLAMAAVQLSGSSPLRARRPPSNFDINPPNSREDRRSLQTQNPSISARGSTAHSQSCIHSSSQHRPGPRVHQKPD